MSVLCMYSTCLPGLSQAKSMPESSAMDSTPIKPLYIFACVSAKAMSTCCFSSPVMISTGFSPWKVLPRKALELIQGMCSQKKVHKCEAEDLHVGAFLLMVIA